MKYRPTLILLSTILPVLSANAGEYSSFLECAQTVDALSTHVTAPPSHAQDLDRSTGIFALVQKLPSPSKSISELLDSNQVPEWQEGQKFGKIGSFPPLQLINNRILVAGKIGSRSGFLLVSDNRANFYDLKMQVSGNTPLAYLIRPSNEKSIYVQWNYNPRTFELGLESAGEAAKAKVSYKKLENGDALAETNTFLANSLATTLGKIYSSCYEKTQSPKSIENSYTQKFIESCKHTSALDITKKFAKALDSCEKLDNKGLKKLVRYIKNELQKGNLRYQPEGGKAESAL